MPTTSVWRRGPASDLGTPSAADQAAIDALAFEGPGRSCAPVGRSLADVYTDGIAVLHRGRLVYERYAGALQPERGCTTCSPSPSPFAGTLA